MRGNNRELASLTDAIERATDARTRAYLVGAKARLEDAIARAEVRVEAERIAWKGAWS